VVKFGEYPTSKIGIPLLDEGLPRQSATNHRRAKIYGSTKGVAMSRMRFTPEIRGMILALAVIAATYFLASQVVAEVRAITTSMNSVAQELAALRSDGVQVRGPVTVAGPVGIVGCRGQSQRRGEEPCSYPLEVGIDGRVRIDGSVNVSGSIDTGN
jgi:hypothetical protein